MKTMTRSQPGRMPNTFKTALSGLRHQFRLFTSSGRVLPSVVLAGVQKGGTTSLYHQLKVHPNVQWVAGKGTHYFDLNFGQGLAWYRSMCPHRLWVERNEYRSPGKTIVAESCGYYFDHPLAAQHCAATLPDARVIIVLRNPVERAYSHYNDSVRKGFESLTFEQAIEQETARLDGEVDKVINDPKYYSAEHRHLTYLSRSTYIDHVQRWMDAMPRENVLILQSEAYYADMEAEYNRVLQFLGLPTWQPEEFSKRNVGNYSEIPPETRKKLVGYFKTHNQRLYDYLGVDFGWD